MKVIFNVRATANGKPPLDDVRVMEPRPSRTKQPPTTGKVQTLPSITRSLRDRRCCDGDTVTFECGLAPTPKQPDVRWEKDGKPLVIEGNLVAEQDSAFARMTILQVYPEDEGEYTCVVRSKLGKVTTSACLIIDVPEEKEALVSGQLSRPPGLLSTESTPRSTPRTTPSRSKSPSMPRRSRARSALDQDTAGANAVNKRHRLKAAPPKLYAIPHNKVVEEGATVRFQCAIAGHPTPWVTWDTDGLILTPSRRLTIKEKDDLRIVEISEVSVEDWPLRGTLENDVGRVEASARLDVIEFIPLKSFKLLPSFALNNIEKLCLKDKLLEDQRKNIDEIQIKLDEKHKELEELRQSLDTQHSAVDRLEADKRQLQQRLLEADEKLEKSVKHDETEHVWRELDERRRQVEQLSREKVALEVGLKLAAFLAALLRRPHLLASFPAANRSSLLQLLDQSRSLDASALAVPAALEDSLLDHIHKFLDVPQHFIHEVVDETGREEGAMVNVRATANGKPPLDDVRVIELRPSRTKQPPQLSENGRAESRPSQASDSQPLVIEGDLVAEQNSAFARLTILQVCPEDEGEYTCVVRSKLGKVTTSACLIVDVPEEKEALLSGQLSRPPGLLSTESTPRSTPRTTPSRSKSPSMPRRSRARSALDQDIAGANAVNKRHRLKAAPPKFYAIPHNKVVEEGATVRFQCAIAGHPTPLVTWDTDGLILTPSRRLTIKERDDLRIVGISEVSVEDAGLNRVTLENDGRVEASARLDVIVTASIWWLGSGCGLRLSGRRRSLCWLFAVVVKKEAEPGTACTKFRKVRVTRVHNPIGTVSQPVSKKEPLQILKVEEMVEIKLDEKQKELEELRQSLDTQDSAVDWLEADKRQLQQRFLEADEKLEKSVKVVAGGADAGVAQPRAGGARGGRRPNLQHDETEHVWRELDETRRQLLDQSCSLDASALAASAAPVDSLLDHIHKFLDAPQHFIHELLDEDVLGAALQPILTRLAEPRDEGDFQCPRHRQRQASAGRRPRHRTETIEDEATLDNWVLLLLQANRHFSSTPPTASLRWTTSASSNRDHRGRSNIRQLAAAVALSASRTACAIR
ncbi:Hypothetical predicted protein [Cloeon dipterum]|uniref:Ig-like domain-containing protein n=1 Tax=Cloeon dipterum TaxID=197152 RepID=A0A8S1DVE3_9INSE|nr:Hypothetical predicted protein [Cloeon dipterum]